MKEIRSSEYSISLRADVMSRKRVIVLVVVSLHVIVLSVFLLFQNLRSPTMTEKYTNVTVSEARAMIDSKQSLVVLDFRTQSEHDSGHMKNSVLFLLPELETRLYELNPNSEILVYCRSGNSSRIASQVLVNNGFLHVFNMLGGILAWIDEGYPVYVKYLSIQRAIDNANQGETIHVASGIYYEQVIVNKTISIVGEDRDTTIVDGEGLYTPLIIVSSGSMVDAFTFQNCGWSTPFSHVAIYGHNNVVRNSRIVALNRPYGIYVFLSNGNKIINNVIENSEEYGIFMFSSDNNIISNNSIDCSNRHGIFVASNSNNNCITSNEIKKALNYGIDVSSSHNNVLSNNSISGCDGAGIYLHGQSNGSLVWGNTVTSSKVGLNQFYSGVSKVFHNNFIGNNISASSTSASSKWDDGYPAGGNYWDDYNYSDLYSGTHQNLTGSDGIADRRYVIDENNTDEYPLMAPVSFYGAGVVIVSNSVITQFELNRAQRTLSFNVAELDLATGFCRVAIPNSLTHDLWLGDFSVVVDGEPAQFSTWIDATYTFIFFEHQYSEHGVIIMFEFKSQNSCIDYSFDSRC